MAATNPGVREAPPYVVSISTSMRCAAAPGEVWSQLMFYEEIRRRPPLLLRLFLPTPIRTDGRKSVIGDQVKCHYTTGYLLKRVTRLVRERVYAFEVIEQNFRLAGGIELLGGSYSLRDLSRAGTEIVLETRYRQVDRSGWARRWIEAAVCHQFHRHILKAMCGDIRTRRIEGRSHEVCA